jgi:hypothetical protein
MNWALARALALRQRKVDYLAFLLALHSFFFSILILLLPGYCAAPRFFFIALNTSFSVSLQFHKRMAIFFLNDL